METPDPNDHSAVTRALERVARGEGGAADELMPLVYDELRMLARARLRGAPPGQTLQATALVHEAWLKLRPSEEHEWDGRRHFFGAAARAMRNIVVDATRRAHSRGERAPFETSLAPVESGDDVAAGGGPDLLELDAVLDRLEREYPRPARVVMLRYFAGLSVPQVAEALDVAPRTVDREWSFARAWLAKALGPD